MVEILPLLHTIHSAIKKLAGVSKSSYIVLYYYSKVLSDVYANNEPDKLSPLWNSFRLPLSESYHTVHEQGLWASASTSLLLMK